ncbi:Uncharacterised protein [Bordetella pertussis]|nr:Uncharacterised protein [Bordetella pertussis]
MRAASAGAGACACAAGLQRAATASADRTGQRQRTSRCGCMGDCSLVSASGAAGIRGQSAWGNK